MDVYSNLFYSDDADPAFGNSIDYRGVTPNESKAHFKNKIERKRMMRAVDSFKLETKYNCSLIHRAKRRISSHMNSIDISTGTWTSNDPNNIDPKNSRCNTAVNERPALPAVLTRQKSAISSTTSPTRGSLSLERPRLSVSLNAAAAAAAEDSEAKQQKKKLFQNDMFAKEILFSLEDTQERASAIMGRVNRSKSVVDIWAPLKRARAQSVFTLINFKKDSLPSFRLSETNSSNNKAKKQPSSSPPSDKIDPSKLIDNDERKLIDIYRKKIETRNSVPVIPPQVVSTLKSKDPVFAKRYRQVYEARLFSKAPKFDDSDNDLDNNFPKVDMWRLRKRVLRQSGGSSVLADKPKVPTFDREKTDEKVKQFIEAVKSSNLC